MTHQEMLIETDLLEGNINRMCVTKDNIELKRMYDFARYRLNKIYEYNKNKLEQAERENKGKKK